MLYLHVGLHKTGTTYFQSAVFPRWNGIRYLRNLSIEGLLKIPQEETCLASREGFSGGVIASQAEKLGFLKRLSEMFPDARILMSFRTHGSYVNAIYSQYLRYGGTAPLSEFFDLEADTGVIRREDLRFRVYVEKIQEYWERPPFVFLLSELGRDKARLMNDLGAFLGSPPPKPETIGKGRRNASLGRPQAEVLRWINRRLGVKLHADGSTRPYRVLRRLGIDPPRLCQRWAELASSPPIMPPDDQERIDAYFHDDWEFLKRYAERRRELCDCL